MRLSLGVIVLALVGAWFVPRAAVAPSALPGWRTYERLCASCHGASGDGRGPAAAYTWGAPRAFADGVYKWRSTGIGAPPTDADLALTIHFGVPGTSMHAFALADADVADLIDVLHAFAPAAFAQRPPAPPVKRPVGPPRPPTSGRELWKYAGCASCHGETGRGDGPAAKAMKSGAPYDLTTQPIRRPRKDDSLASRRAAILSSLGVGLSGTAMPAYNDSLSSEQMEAITEYVLELNASAVHGGSDLVAPRRDRSALDPSSIDADKAKPLIAGTWPGTGDDAVIFGAAVPPQGPPPSTLAPAQASLSAQQCARCHAKQSREWSGSIHARAAGPGLIAQVDYALAGEKGANCRRCHTPLAEQATDRSLFAEGIQCAGCHVRTWTRHGPEGLAPSLATLPNYPLQTMSLYERSDFCMTCHQLPPRGAVNGKPLLNTYKEWLEGPYMRRGVQCQNCHMPNREHTFLGIHDADTVRQAFELTATAHRSGVDGAFESAHAIDASQPPATDSTDAWSHAHATGNATTNRPATTSRSGDTTTLAVEITNIGAGHYFPTTPTPEVHVVLELLDENGTMVPGASETVVIGRALTFDGSWHETSDTRIPPGETRSIARAWRDNGRAKSARVTIEVWPDALYERIYAQRLKTSLDPAQVPLYQRALSTALARRFIAEQRVLTIP
ncbi:MAG TPA: c-type cytochrome [Kofleriaceae bacterium]